jgi:hypothetical protein
VQKYIAKRDTEIERIRGAYVALLPGDPEARRAELEALKRELHLHDLDPTLGTKRRQAPKNRRPMESWLSRHSQSGTELESTDHAGLEA